MKLLKLIPSDQNRTFGLCLLFILLSSEVDLILKVESCKQYLIEVSSPNGDKIVFTLLTKIIAFYIKLTVIQVR